jgi:putative heme iron utilization protein
MSKQQPYRPVDDDARRLARSLITQAHFAALAVRDVDGAPLVSRIAVAPTAEGAPMALASDLSQHSQCLKSDPVASLLLGEPKDRGDPLTYPRLTLQAKVHFIRFVAHQPKTKLYIGFSDFAILTFEITTVFLNGGFGKAYNLRPSDLITPTNQVRAGSVPR